MRKCSASVVGCSVSSTSKTSFALTRRRSSAFFCNVFLQCFLRLIRGRSFLPQEIPQAEEEEGAEGSGERWNFDARLLQKWRLGESEIFSWGA